MECTWNNHGLVSIKRQYHFIHITLISRPKKWGSTYSDGNFGGVDGDVHRDGNQSVVRDAECC